MKATMNQPEVIQIGNLVENGSFDNPQRGRVYDIEGISPCLNGLDSGNNMPKILEIMEEPRIKQMASSSLSSACNAKVLDADGLCPALLDHKGAEPAVVIGSTQANAYRGSLGDVAPTLTTSSFEQNKNTMYRIRKLTPRECLRLMRFSEKSIDAMQSAKVPFETKKGIVYKPMPKTQLYKQAGNSIDCGMIYELGRTMWIADQPENEKKHQPSLFDL